MDCNGPSVGQVAALEVCNAPSDLALRRARHAQRTYQPQPSLKCSPGLGARLLWALPCPATVAWAHIRAPRLGAPSFASAATMKVRGIEPGERKYVRAIVRQVHPDLFAAYPYERAKNSESLKVVPGTTLWRRGRDGAGLARDWCW